VKYTIKLILSILISLNFTINADPQYNITSKNVLVTAYVQGMVCDFCARGLEKLLNNYDDIKAVNINLEKSTVSIELSAKSTLSNKDITEIIKNNGITTVHIERNAITNSTQKNQQKQSFWTTVWNKLRI
tara:strand:+ start:266 stop:655 length:390 start_codon:yes stop_codon:yes gene_type:complete